MQNEQMTDEEMNQRDRQQTPLGVNYPASSVQDNMKRLQAEGKIDATGADAIFWLYSYSQEYGLSYSGIKEKTGISAAFALFHGNYQAEYGSMVKKILSFKALTEKRNKEHTLGFVMTATAKQIFDVCDAALYDGMPAYIFGASQTGKTTALLEYQRTHNHGTTKYIRMGVRWSKRRLVRELARACKCFCETAHTVDLEERIAKTLNNRMLLIIDEFHLAIETTTDLAAKEVVEYVREIYDLTHCGLVICGTKVAETGLESGKNAMLFDQMRRRGLVKLVLPDVPKLSDVNMIAREFGLDRPTGETLESIKAILRRFGLGEYVKFLQKTYATANATKKDISWTLFAKVANGYAKLSVAENDY